MRSRFIFFSIILLQLTPMISCRTKVKQDLAEVSHVEYSDSQEFFTVQLTGSYKMSETSEGQNRTLRIIATEDPGSDAYHEIRISLLKKEDPEKADLYVPGYETDFIKKCSCVITERGIVNFAGSPARHYIVSLKNNSWIGFQRHIKKDDMIVRIIVEGPRGNAASLRKIFDEVIQDFKFVNKNIKSEKKDTSVGVPEHRGNARVPADQKP